MDDEALLALLQAQDPQVIPALEQAYGPYCRSIALRLTPGPEDAEEILNDVWLRAWESPPAEAGSLRHYLARLTRNLAYDLARRQQAEKRGGGELPLVLEELAGCLPGPETPESLLSAKELGAAVSRFLHTQRPQSRDIFLRRYFFAESVPDIARRYHMRQDNVRLTLSRTRARLKAYLKKGGYL